MLLEDNPDKKDDAVDQASLPEPEEEDDEEEEEYTEETFTQLNSDLDRLCSALDRIEDQRDAIHQQLSELLNSNKEVRKEMLDEFPESLSGLNVQVSMLQETLTSTCLQVDELQDPPEDPKTKES